MDLRARTPHFHTSYLSVILCYSSDTYGSRVFSENKSQDILSSDNSDTYDI